MPGLWLGLLAAPAAWAAEAPPPAQPAPCPAAAPQAAAPCPPAPAPHNAGDNSIVVVSHHGAAPGDPAQKLNQASFVAVQYADRKVVGPAAMVYKAALPEPLRDGLHNGIYNLREPAVFAAFLMQHRIGKAGATLARFVVNSTVGIGGLFDVARLKPLYLARRQNGLADTLGFYGVGPGPYMFLPILGPTTLRDVIGLTVDRMTLPLAVGAPLRSPAFGTSLMVVGGLDDRLQRDPQLRQIAQDPNPYVAMREAYLQERRDEIAGLHKGAVKAAQ